MFIAVFSLFLASLPPQAREPSTERVEQLRAADTDCNHKRFAEAENSYKSLLVVYPDFTEVLTKLGRCYLAMGRAKDAAQVFGEAVEDLGDEIASS